MNPVARAMRGPLWLVWLSLLCAGQLAAGDAAAGADSEDVPDRQPFHLSARTGALPTVVAATFIAVPDNQDELAALGIASVALPLCVRDQAPSPDGRRVESFAAPSPRNPRAPPLSLLLSMRLITPKE